MSPRRTLELLLASGVIALGIVTGVPPVKSQEVDVWRQAAAADSVPRSIAEAEAQGGRHPRSARPAEFRPRAAESVSVGTAERRCVIVGDANVARSGDLIASPFRLYRDYWRQGAPPKVSWVAGHRPPLGEPVQLLIEATRLDEPAASYVFLGDVDTFRWSAIAMMELMRIPWGTAAVFDIPTPGRWLLVATVAENWGCFVLDLPAAADTP